MKIAALTFASIATFCLATSASAQVLTQVGGETNSGTDLGSPSEYIIFNGSNYNVIGSDAAGSYKNLPDFEIVGGEAQVPGDAGYSTINTPGNVSSLHTGGIFSTNTIAVGLELLDLTALGTSTSGFNYNDFNVYVMIDNAPGDLAIQDDGVGLDARLDNVELTPVHIITTNSNASLTSADFVEFNVTGLGTAVAAARVTNPSAASDLVLRIFKPNGDDAVMGGLSFESVPEPSTWAMLFAGAAALFFVARRAKSSAR
jgi:hypothetical protein